MLSSVHEAGEHIGGVINDKTQSENVCSREDLLAAYGRGERNFKGIHLDHADLSGCDLSGIDLSEASLVETVWNGTDLKESTFCKADLTGASLSRCNLSKSDLSWANLSNAALVGADMRKCSARAANFSNALMLRTRLNDADCLGAIFTHVNATAALFESTNLECADLSHVTMMNASLCGANCSWANLASARLNWANLSWCLLDAADLHGANLTGALLRAASLTYADLEDAVFTGADLYFAELSGALVPPNAFNTARVASVRLTSNTFTRSKWTKEQLRDWQQKGAIILDLGELPKDVQTFIIQGECSLRIEFSIPIDSDCQIALETLIHHLFGREASLRILSIVADRKKSTVAFYSDKTEEVEDFANCLQTRSWRRNSGRIESMLAAVSSPSRLSPPDILRTLGILSDNILQIQALLPVSQDDQTRRYKALIAPNEPSEGRTPVSWSSITLTKVSR